MLTHQLTENVKVLHKVALVCGQQVLILKRSETEYSRPGLWDLPGGNATWPQTDSGNIAERLHQADILREVGEETSIDLAFAADQLEMPVYANTYFEPDSKVYTVVLGWSVQVDRQPSVVLSDEHSQFAWITWAQFDEYDFGFAGEQDGFIRQIVSRSLQQHS